MIAASCAALCCAGAPIIVSVLAATGLSFLRTDAILLPIIAVALAIALVGFWTGRRIHGSNGLLAIGAIGSVALVAGWCSFTARRPKCSSVLVRFCSSRR